MVLWRSRASRGSSGYPNSNLVQGSRNFKYLPELPKGALNMYARQTDERLSVLRLTRASVL